VPDDEQKKDDTPPADVPAADTPEDEAAAGPAKGPTGTETFGPDAIMARVGAIGEETEIERVAREEEHKLLERKKAKRAKKGLEAAASKRLARIGEGKVKRPSATLGASPDADPLLERAARLGQWIREHRQTFGAFLAVALLGAAGGLGYTYWQGKQEAEASALLAKAFADEHGAVSDKDEDEEDAKTRPLYPTFKTAGERREAALSAYRQVESKFAGTGAAILAKLAEAGLLLDAGDAKGARAAYEDVKSSALAQADAQVRGRTLEGIGFANELLAQSDASAKDKHLDDALASFKALEGVDAKGFKELGQYHQARVLQAKGDKAKAVELLKDVQKRVSEPGESHPFAYLEVVAEDRLRALDPTALPPKAPKGVGAGAGGAGDMNDPQIQEILRQLQQQGKMPAMPGAPPMPGAPVVPGMPNVPGVPGAPRVPGAPPVPGVPK
jgi:hypothetical protein